MRRESAIVTPSRDYLMRHRANCLADACWGLYAAFDGQEEPRRWLVLAPRAPIKSSGGGTKGAMLVDSGDGLMTLGQAGIPTVKAQKAGYLDVYVPGLEKLGVEPHRVALMRTDYEHALDKMPAAWAREWQRMERCTTRTSLFRYVENKRMKSASLYPHHYTSDPLMCAGLYLTELCSDWGMGEA